MPNSLKSLLPCPFCELSVARITNTRELNYSTVCFAYAVICDADSDGCGAISGWHSKQEFAITAWNTRAPIAEGGGDALDARRYQTVRQIAEHRWRYENGFMRFDTPVYDGRTMTFDEAIDDMAQPTATAAIESLSRQGGEVGVGWYRHAVTGELFHAQASNGSGSTFGRHYSDDDRGWVDDAELLAEWEPLNVPTRASEAGDSKDAARYRWLRDNCTAGSFSTYEPGFRLNCDEPASEWDAAIDIAAAPAPGGGK